MRYRGSQTGDPPFSFVSQSIYENVSTEKVPEVLWILKFPLLCGRGVGRGGMLSRMRPKSRLFVEPAISGTLMAYWEVSSNGNGLFVR